MRALGPPPSVQYWVDGPRRAVVSALERAGDDTIVRINRLAAALVQLRLEHRTG
jgi:hypothetical protein